MWRRAAIVIQKQEGGNICMKILEEAGKTLTKNAIIHCLTYFQQTIRWAVVKGLHPLCWK